MKRFLALLMALAMTFSIVVPSIASAHEWSSENNVAVQEASGNAASHAAPQSENADEAGDSGKSKGDSKSKDGDKSKDEGNDKSKDGDKSKDEGNDKSKDGDKSQDEGADKSKDGDKSRDEGADKSKDGDKSRDEGADKSKDGDKSQDGGADKSRDGDKSQDAGADGASDGADSASSQGDAPGSGDGQEAAPEEEQEAEEEPAEVEETPLDPNLHQLRASLKCANGTTYVITLTCPDEAEIPEGAELSLTELNEELTKKEKKLPENKNRPYKTEKFVSKKNLEQLSFDLTQGLKVSEDDYVLFTKFLDLSLTLNGKEVRPKAPVEVTVETNVVSEGASDTLEAALYDADATKEWSKGLKERRAKTRDRLPDTVYTNVKADNETEKGKGVKLRFKTKEFSRLGLAGLVKTLKSWDCQGETVRVYGPRHLKAKVQGADMKDPEAGLEKLRAFRVELTEKKRPNYDVKFWVGRVESDGLGVQEEADRRVGVAARKLKGDKALFNTEDAAAPVSFQENEAVGLLWDTGFRDQTLRTADVTLSGLLPKGAQAEAVDVSEAYSKPDKVKKDRSEEQLSTVAAYDITIKDGEDAYQPGEGESVEVAIQCKGISKKKKLEVWHILDSGAVEVVKDFTVKGDIIRFPARGFSVYMVVENNPALYTYTFYSYNDAGARILYKFETEEGDTTSSVTIKSGEKLSAPQNPTNPKDPDATFVGWYARDPNSTEPPASDGTPALVNEAFDFDHPNPPEDTYSVDLYAKFASVWHVRFHGYNTDGSSFTSPVIKTVTIPAEDGAAISLSGITTGYSDSSGNNAFPAYEFYGWTDADTAPSAGTIPADGKIPDGAEDQYLVQHTTDLYPLFAEIRWLTPVSGNAGTSAKYFPPFSFQPGNGPTSLSHYIPTRPGYVFQGWYLDVENVGQDSQNGKEPQLTDASGAFLSTFDNTQGEAFGVQVNGGQLYLDGTRDNVRIYARWAVQETPVNYTIVVWRQLPTDGTGEAHYECAESFTLSGSADASVSVADDYKNLSQNAPYNALHPGQSVTDETNPYHSYTFNADKSEVGPKSIKPKGNRVFNLYYDYSGTQTTPEGAYTLRFLSLYDGTALAAEPVELSSTSLAPGAPISSHAAPQKPETAPEGCEASIWPEGYDFYWYADKACSTRVFFADDAEYQNYDDSKVLYTAMPGHNLNLYGRWNKRRFRVRIDPNYGSLAREEGGNVVGTGATWFNVDYGERIEEYTHVTRDYVPSKSGSYYYVRHDQSSDPDRYTYYTTDLTKATELTTYKLSPDVYSGIGWFEEGAESKYDFTTEVTHDTTLVMRWKRAGSFYLEYNTEAVLKGKTLKGTLLNGSEATRDEGYSDQAVLFLTGQVNPPESYEFIGWHIRGDESDKIYYPGTSFTLDAEYAVTVNGKQKVFLDAVYSQISRAKIVYDANGGTIDADSVDFGAPVDEDAPEVKTSVHKPGTGEEGNETATISNLVNNSEIQLSSGAGFSCTDPVSGAPLTLVGWYQLNEDGTKTSFALGATQNLYVDTNEPVTLYADWQVTVTFVKPEGTTWSGNWGGYSEDASGNKTLVTSLHATLDEPAGTVTGPGGQKLDFWCRTNDNDYTNVFNYGSDQVTGNLTLYASMTTAEMVPFHVLEQSGSGYLNKDGSWRPTPNLRVAPGQTIDLTSDSEVASYLTISNPEDYVFVGAYVGTEPITEQFGDSAKITAVKNDSGTVKVTQNGTEVPLAGNIYLVYRPGNPLSSKDVKIVYVKESAGGDLSTVQGVGGDITYNGQPISMNGQTVAQNQIVTVTGEETLFSQEGTGFHVPPLLDSGTNPLDLFYASIGVGGTGLLGGISGNTADLNGNISTDLKLHLKIEDNRLKWRFDESKPWSDFSESNPTVYIIYQDRGYDLTLTKRVTGDDTGIDPDTNFRISITSDAILRSSYEVEDIGYTSVPATPAANGQPGRIDLTLKADDKIRIKGLARGDYTVVENLPDSSFVMNAKVNGEQVGTDNPAIQLALPLTGETDARVELTNNPQYICQVPYGDQEPEKFYTLNRALSYVQEQIGYSPASIQMLMDYTIPASDALTIPEGYDITLTSATESQRYTITRSSAFESGAMFTNHGTLKLDNITLDGGSDGSRVSANAPTVWTDNQLTVESSATLQNAYSSKNGGAIYATGTETNPGVLNLNGTFENNRAVRGGAVYAVSGEVNVTGGSFTGNKAGSGGAIYYGSSDKINLYGGSFTGNTALTGNGGAIYAVGGSIDLANASTLSQNTAQAGSGGAIFAENAVIALSSDSAISGNSAKSGGGIYAQVGEITMSGTMSGNKALNGSGGGVYLDRGQFTMSTGTMTKNEATSRGGAVYTNAGELSLSGGTIGGGNDTSNANSAQNGSALFVNTGEAHISNITITKNTTSDTNPLTAGGAVGVGTDSARLYFTGTPVVKENNQMTKESGSGNTYRNVYLDQDSAIIFNATDLTGNFYIGIYVPGPFEETLFQNRGTVCARFGIYETLVRNDVKNKIQNDRLSGVETDLDTSTYRLFWSRSFKVQVRTLDSYGTALPPQNEGTTVSLSKGEWYNPPSSKNAASAIAEDVVEKKEISNAIGTRAFNSAFVRTTNSSTFGTFDDYVKELNWDDDKGKWVAVLRNGAKKPLDTDSNKVDYRLYYSNPAYLSVENNSDYDLTVNNLKVAVAGSDRNAINTASQTGFGYVVSIDGETQSALLPIDQVSFPAGKKASVNDAGQLVLQSGCSIKLMFPGARGQKFKLEGSFGGTEHTQIPCTLDHGTAYNDVYADTGISLTGDNRKLRNDADTYEIILNGKKPICKIVAPGVIAGTESLNPQNRSDGKVEYLFTTLTAARDFATTYQPTSQIEMLTDYLISTADHLEIPKDCHITITTAVDGIGQQYPRLTGVTDESRQSARRATLGRDAGYVKPLIQMVIENGEEGSLTVNQVNFDGKNMGTNNQYGIIRTMNCNVSISNAKFDRCKAQTGGGISVDFSETYSGNYSLTVSDCEFVGCYSLQGTRAGGGAIWTCAKEFYLYNSTFRDCEAFDQGGAVFHRIDAKKISTTNGKTKLFTYAEQSLSVIDNCHFINCIAQAAGGLESEAFDFRMSNCTFNNCKATKRNAGAVNVYIYEGPNSSNMDSVNAPGTKATFTSCTFNNCSCGNRGGGIRCTSLSLYVNDCSFKNCTGKEIGGAICVQNDHAQELVIKGTTIDNCSGGNGGGVYCSAPVLKLEDYTYPAGTEPGDKNVGRYNSSYTVRYNEIKNCVSNASEGGAICHKKRKTQNTANQEGLTIDSADSLISGNKTLTNGKSGGGIYTDAWNVLVKGCTIQNNTCTSNGGGICHNVDNANYRLTIDHCTIKGNQASGYGGGVYTKSQLTLRNDTMVTENHLTSANKNNAAGVYMKDNGRTLTVGDASKANDSNYVDNTSVVGNTLTNAEPSNQVLWWNSNTNPKNENNVASVEVLCNLGGEIRVIRAAKKGTIFGTAKCTKDDKFSGFSILGKDVFIADDGSLYGVYNRLQDFSGDHANDDCQIIWRGDVICKFTDEAGNLLYLDDEGFEPAIFDRLDYATDGSMASAFSYLRKDEPALYKKTQSGTLESFNVNTTKFCLKLLVETIQPADQNTTSGKPLNNTGDYPARNMVLTTAGRMDEGFPYTGKVNTCSVIKGSSNKTVLSARSNVTLNNVILDGTGTDKSRGIISDPASADMHVEIRLEKGAIIREFRCNGDGGGVNLKNSSLVIDGGSIYNCTASSNGGGVYHKDKGSVTLQAGAISNCKATGTGNNGLGGGIFYNANAKDNDSWLTMSGGLINGCEAQKGGGIYVAGSRILEMTGGTITANSATANGGGIATEDKAQLHFSRVVTVSGNKMGGKSCNVQLDYDKNSIIYSYSSKYTDKNGALVLDRGSYVGVYCPGNYVPLTDADREAGKTHNDADDGIYKKHGGEKDPFGTWNQTSDTEANKRLYKYLYCFVNDRNGLKGGLQYGDTMTQNRGDTNIYWIKIYSLKISKQVLSDLPSEMNNDEFTFRVTLFTDAGGNYTEVNNEFDLLYSYQEDTGTIRSGDALKLKNEQYVTVDNLPTTVNGKPLRYKVEELITDNMYYTGSNKLKYTTTTYNSTGESTGRTSNSYYIQGRIGDGAGNPLANEYLSVAAFTNQKAIVKLTYNGNLLYYVKDNRYVPAVYSRLYLAFDQLNGASESKPLYYKNPYSGSNTWLPYDGSESCNTEMLIPAYTMTQDVALDGDKTTVLTTAKWNARDGYPYSGTAGTTCEITRGTDNAFKSKSMFTANGDLTMKDIQLNGNGENVTASANGGIVNVPKDGSLTLTDGSVLNHSTTTGKGAGVYVASGGTVHLKGDFAFGGTDRYEEGDDIPSGKSVGDLRNESGNFCTKSGVLASGAQNGGKSYTKAHQDIYLEENHPAAPASIILESNLDGDDGSIWVWADKAAHHKELMPFAKLANGVDGGNLKVFRNAQPDLVTENGTGDWLHGTSADELGETAGFVYWNGVRGAYRVILRKVNGVHAPLPNVTMTVYRKGSETAYEYKDEDNVTHKLENLTTDSSGVFWVGMLPYGEYWVHESKVGGTATNWWFVLTVDASGATFSERSSTKPTTT